MLYFITMKTLRLLLVMCLVCAHSATAVVHPTLAQQRQQVDKVKETKTLRGRFVGFEIGDYTHAVIRKGDGKRTSFFINQPGMDYFLASHKGQSLELTYQVVDTYIPEAGGVETIERLVSARAGNVTYREWWKKVKASASMRQIERRYDPLVRASVINQ